ncbi:FecR family protein [Flavitalea flava]
MSPEFQSLQDMDSAQRFAYLFQRYYEKNSSPSEKDEFFDMLRRGEHDEILRRLLDETWQQDLPGYHQKNQTAHTILEHIIRQQPEKTAQVPVRPIPIPRSRVFSPRLLRYATAAAIFALVLISFFTSLFHADSRPSKIEDPVPKPLADQYIILSEGSKVLLHKGAHIEYQTAFSGETREVYLTGEAYFDIRKDKRPFIVHTGNVKTTVLGTAFNINAVDKNITVTVTKGKVKVENEKGEFSIIKRNEQITVDVSHNSLKKAVVDANEVIVWKKPYLLLNDIRMKEAVQELEQRFHVVIGFGNPALETCSVTASFIHDESIEQIIKVLAKINNMEYKIINPGKFELDGDGCN